MARILIIRFSALGDVAMTIPVVHFAGSYNILNFEIYCVDAVLCWQPLFSGTSCKCEFLSVTDLTGKHKGLWGLNTLYSGTESKEFSTMWHDFHHVLRTKYLCLRFRLANIPVASIYKGRVGKEKLVRRLA